MPIGHVLMLQMNANWGLVREAHDGGLYFESPAVEP